MAEKPTGSKTCPLCGFAKFDGYGHPYGGKRTPPKTLWCTGKPSTTWGLMESPERVGRDQKAREIESISSR